MDTTKKEREISDDDLRAALKEMRTYVDVTEEDLKKIYSIALRHAEERLASKIAVGDIMTKRVITVKRDSDIHEVSILFSENRISGPPVVDSAFTAIFPQHSSKSGEVTLIIGSFGASAIFIDGAIKSLLPSRETCWEVT